MAAFNQTFHHDPSYYDLRAPIGYDARIQELANRRNLMKQDLINNVRQSIRRLQNSLRELDLQLVQHYPFGFESRRLEDQSKFQLPVNVKYFEANEIVVSIVDDGYVVVTAKHSERPDNQGFVSRSFSRRYKLPDDVDSDKITSSLSTEDGILTIKGPRKVDVPPPFEGYNIVLTKKERQPSVLQESVVMNGEPVEKPVPKVDSENVKQ